MRADYQQWLERNYQAGTAATQMYRAARIELYYGDLDEIYGRDRMSSLMVELTYSMEDARRGRANPSRIPIDGDIRANLASYRDAVNRYGKFRNSCDDVNELPLPEGEQMGVPPAAKETLGERIGFERDLQAALRREIEQLEGGLVIADDGAERSVDSGFIDITAKDASGTTVVIELKAGTATQRAIGQILSYMGDVASDEVTDNVRGILVASDFDTKAKAAARMVPLLILRKYGVKFSFSDGQSQ